MAYVVMAYGVTAHVVTASYGLRRYGRYSTRLFGLGERVHQAEVDAGNRVDGRLARHVSADPWPRHNYIGHNYIWPIVYMAVGRSLAAP